MILVKNFLVLEIFWKLFLKKKIAKVIFKERDGNHHNSPSESFEWIIKKVLDENFIARDVGIFIEANFQEIVVKNLFVQHIHDNCFRIIKIQK